VLLVVTSYKELISLPSLIFLFFFFSTNVYPLSVALLEKRMLSAGESLQEVKLYNMQKVDGLED
jgi:hypothetical protein